jgi:predicted nucleic acid-binding Zn ribbon protein
MPIYEYRRPDGTTFEIQQTFSEDALTVDPDTGVPVERVLHPPAVHFKGKGFYNTDYGTRNRQRETAAAEASSKDSSSKDSSSKDSASAGSSSATDSKDSSPAGKTAGAKGSKDSAKGKDSKPVAANS